MTQELVSPEYTLILSTPLVLSTRSAAFVLPIKSLAQIAFPESDQPEPHPPPPLAAAHLAFPEASEVRT